MTLLEDLLGRGYLPVQLPPGFSSSTFANNLNHFQKAWDSGSPPATLGERFSVARSSFYRRSTTIINPIGFYFLAREIAKFWPQIDLHYKQSTLSRSVPLVDQDSLRAIKLRKFSELYEEKVTSSAGYQFALVTDITSFFSAIYTHTIPWALHTKSVAKKNKSKKTAKYYGNILDARCMATQDGQTIGLPIGPDTSHILAEIVAVAIDEQLRQNWKSWPAGFRYVDDFYLFFNGRDDAERALAAVTKAVGSYELQLNPAKTRIIEVRELVQESWKYNLKKLSLSASKKEQRDDIHHYFELLFSLEKQFKDESLVKYGLKQLSSKIVKKSNWQVLEAYLLECGYGFPNAIEVIAHFLTTYRHHGYPLDIAAITRFCHNLIRVAAATDHHSEVAWLLWICKELSISLEMDLAPEIERMRSSVCTLILLDMQHSGLSQGTVDPTLLAPFATPDNLIGPHWLLAYEAGRRKWLGGNTDAFITNDAYFGPLLKSGVVFYDEQAKLPPMFELKADIPLPPDFDSDEEIAEDFEFDDIDEEYFDSSGAAKESDEDNEEGSGKPSDADLIDLT